MGEGIIEVPINNPWGYPELRDTIICSYSREDELAHIMSTKQIYERSKIIANCAMPHDMIYYVNEHGVPACYMILED